MTADLAQKGAKSFTANNQAPSDMEPSDSRWRSQIAWLKTYAVELGPLASHPSMSRISPGQTVTTIALFLMVSFYSAGNASAQNYFIRQAGYTSKGEIFGCAAIPTDSSRVTFESYYYDDNGAKRNITTTSIAKTVGKERRFQWTTGQAPPNKKVYVFIRYQRSGNFGPVDYYMFTWFALPSNFARTGARRVQAGCW